MSTRGVIQLRRLTLWYCEHGGSSQSVRDLLADGAPALVEWARTRPQIEVNVRCRNGKHPFVQAEYRTGSVKRGTDNINQHQVCVRNGRSRKPDILAVMDALYNRSGRKISKLVKPVYTDTPSIQGVWTPALNLHLEPEFPMEFVSGVKDQPDAVPSSDSA